MSKSALGRGLSALLGGASPTPGQAPSAAPPSMTAPESSVPSGLISEPVQRIPLDQIQPSSLQPRKDFPADSLQELADSIREKGILQPIIVRPRPGGYELIAGERRWRAAQVVGLKDIPTIVRDADDHTVLEWMLIENLQRENLNAIEEALGYHQLLTQFQLRQEDIAQRVGKNRATVANALRLLKLSPQLQVWVRNGQISTGHAKVILGLENPEEQQLAATRVIKDGLSVRATEELVGQWLRKSDGQLNAKSAGQSPAGTRDVHVDNLEQRLQERLGTKVQLKYRQGKGSVVIHFFNDDDLDRVLDLLSIRVD